MVDVASAQAHTQRERQTPTRTHTNTTEVPCQLVVNSFQLVLCALRCVFAPQFSMLPVWYFVHVSRTFFCSSSYSSSHFLFFFLIVVLTMAFHGGMLASWWWLLILLRKRKKIVKLPKTTSGRKQWKETGKIRFHERYTNKPHWKNARAWKERGRGRERIERNAQGWNNERILIMISWDVAHEPKWCR